MIARLIAAVFVSSAVLSSGAARGAAPGIDPFAGVWAGPIDRREGDLLKGIDELELRIEPAGNGFRYTLAAPGRRLVTAELVPAGRPGVWEVGKGGGLFGMFGPRRTGNPLTGQELVWARNVEGGLVVYTLAIVDGAHRLDRMAWQRQGDRLVLEFQHREHGREPEHLLAVLQPRGR